MRRLRLERLGWGGQGEEARVGQVPPGTLRAFWNLSLESRRSMVLWLLICLCAWVGVGIG